MQHNLIKEIIGLDKQAREKVAMLIKKKENLDNEIKRETKKIQKSLFVEIKQSISSTKQKLERLVAEKQDKEVLEYEKTLKGIKKRYNSNKDLWIQEIAKACKK